MCLKLNNLRTKAGTCSTLSHCQVSMPTPGNCSNTSFHVEILHFLFPYSGGVWGVCLFLSPSLAVCMGQSAIILEGIINASSWSPNFVNFKERRYVVDKMA